MDIQDESVEPESKPGSGTGLKKEISGKTLFLLLLVFSVGGLLYWGGPGLLEAWHRRSIVHHEQPPTEWKGIRLGITRADAAQMLVDNHVVWNSVPPPGMQVTEWASHINTTVNGYPAKAFALRFADGLRWDYGAHPAPNDEIVDVKRLVGSFDAASALTGVMWTVERSDYDIANETVPVDVLKVTGESHTVHRDITGGSNIYMWKWPEIECLYSTIDSNFRLQTRGDQ